MTRWPVVVIGGGVVGSAVLWAFARRGIAGLLLEAEADVCEGTSKANSGIIHTGFDATPGSLEATLLRRASDAWPQVLDSLEVPHLRVGAIMAARSDDELSALRLEYSARAMANGVAVTMLDRSEALRLAPYLSPSTVGAMSIPNESVVDPFWLTRAFATAAIESGAQVNLREPVVAIDASGSEVVVRTTAAEHIGEHVVIAAGMASDEIARLLGDDTFGLRPRKGAFLVSEDAYDVDRIVLPVPGPLGKGMLVTPIVFGGVLLGPTAVDGTDRTDRRTTAADRATILESTARLVPAMAMAKPIRAFAGIRHVSSTGDYIIRTAATSDRVHVVAGIRSTGVSTSHAIGDHVARDVIERRGWDAREPRQLHPSSRILPDAPGKIVCICRAISESEVVATMSAPLQPQTLDGVKRRCGAGFGDCQGNLCNMEIADILATYRDVPTDAVEKHATGSWLFASGPRRPALDGDTAATAREIGNESVAADVVVIGGGASGTAAVRILAAHGLRTALIDRGASAGRLGSRQRGNLPGLTFPSFTAIGLDRFGDRWSVAAQGSDSLVQLEAPDVIIATGAFYRPREARDIAGPRPSGVMTADQAWTILARGLQPGRATIVVSPHDEHALVAALGAAGVKVQVIADQPDEIAGTSRLTAVRIGRDWIEGDTLIFADILDPQAFLLRGIGLLDRASGTRPSVGDDGWLGVEGLWAAGCCVAPDPRHDGCEQSGHRVGTNVAVRRAVAS